MILSYANPNARTYGSKSGTQQEYDGVSLDQQLAFIERMIAFYDDHDFLQDETWGFNDGFTEATTTRPQLREAVKSACLEGSACFAMTDWANETGDSPTQFHEVLGVMTNTEIIGNVTIIEFSKWLRGLGVEDPDGRRTPVAYYNDAPGRTKEDVVGLLRFYQFVLREKIATFERDLQAERPVTVAG